MKINITALFFLIFSLTLLSQNTNNSCENPATLKKDSTKIAITQDKYWFKYKADTSVYHNLSFTDNDDKDIPFLVFLYHENCCNDITTKSVTPYSGYTGISERIFDGFKAITQQMINDCIKNGTCFCSSCRKTKKKVYFEKDTTYLILVYANKQDFIASISFEEIKREIVIEKTSKPKRNKQQIIDENNLESVLTESSEGDILTLGKIQFHPNSPRLLKESLPVLFSLQEYLNKNKTIKIQIRGHVNMSPDMKLSKARAKTVYNYLIKHNIDKKRLSTKGFSNTKMLFPNPKTSYEMQQNRRVDIMIVGK